MSAALICTMPFTSVSQVVTAVDNTEIDEDEYYTINSYNKDDIVFDEEGAVVKGHAYCLDYKCHTPAGQKFGVFHGEDRYTTSESDRLLRLPMYYNLTDEDINKVIDTVIKFYKG